MDASWLLRMLLITTGAVDAAGRAAQQRRQRRQLPPLPRAGAGVPLPQGAGAGSGHPRHRCHPTGGQCLVNNKDGASDSNNYAAQFAFHCSSASRRVHMSSCICHSCRWARQNGYMPMQVGRTLADSLHQSAGSSGLHRMAVSAADAGASPPPPHATWHSYYNELALQLIASTTAAGIANIIRRQISAR